jgi:hypothetical protein
MQGDPRAMENPISAIFDLSEDVVRQARVISNAVTYATVFMGIWLFINLVLLVVFFFSLSWLLFLLSFSLFVVGMMALVMLRRTASFFEHYVVRHAAIKAVRDADPLVYAPKGSTPVERLVAYLRATTPALNVPGVELAMPGIVEGLSRLQYKFDVYARKEPDRTLRALGLGDPGLAVFVKVFEARPSADDILSFKKAVEDVSSRTRIQPLRAIILWSGAEGAVLDDAAYNTLVGNQIRFSGGLNSFNCAIELVSERSGGEYDFVPFLAPARR